MQGKRNIENVIQEIMMLIDVYAASDSTNLRILIESKLRELVENKFSMQEPLIDDAITILDHKVGSEHLADVVWMDADTYAALQKTPTCKKTRWPVYKLSEWEDKRRFIALSPLHAR